MASNNSHLSAHSPVGQRPRRHSQGLTLTPAVGWTGLARGAMRDKAVELIWVPAECRPWRLSSEVPGPAGSQLLKTVLPDTRTLDINSEFLPCHPLRLHPVFSPCFLPCALGLPLPLPLAAQETLLLLKGSPMYYLLLPSVCVASPTSAKSFPEVLRLVFE